VTAAADLRIALGGGATTSGLWLAPADATACLVLAHGAGVGMSHPSMAALAQGLAVRGVATLRYNFPYWERGSRRPDSPAVATATVRAAVSAAADRAPSLPLFAGGRSFGGRMSSQAAAAAPMAGLRGLVFFAFPLHPAGKPATERAGHLGAVRLPMLFLQGTNDALAELELLRDVVAGLGRHATLALLDSADHAFHVPARSGRKDAEVLAELLDIAACWMADRSGAIAVPPRSSRA